MNIQRVKIKEFKIIKDLDKEINGHNILLLGDNGVGKSSFIQFVEIALGKQSNIPPNAFGSGEVITDRNGKQYVFKVEMEDGKAKVTVKSPEGLKDSRKASIQGLVGAMEFDVMEFVELSKTATGRRKQIELFESFLDQDTRLYLGKVRATIKTNYEERTEINKTLKGIQIECSSHKHAGEADLSKYTEVVIESIYADLKKAQANNDKIKEVDSRIQERNRAIDKAEKEIERLQKEIEANQKLNAQANEWYKTNKPIDITGFEKQIGEATEKNQLFSEAKELKKKRLLLAEMEEESQRLTEIIESQRTSMLNSIRELDTPIEGLSFTEEELTYNGIPVNPDTLSSSEIMELGIRLKMAENPDLGILFLQRGESLGAKRLDEIKSIAKKAGWQLIMEQVQRGTEELVIELIAE